MSFEKMFNQIKDDIITARRSIHKHPELDFELYQTSETICSVLDKYNISYKKGIAKTGILACIGTNTDKVLLIRADMDALPIKENTGLEYASVNDGVMHACGHDIHIASVLATAVILKQCEHLLNGTVKIMFQPAEETTGGALPMIEEGILDNPRVTCAIGGHVDSSIELGKIMIKCGALMASPDDFEIEFIGKSTHAAQPQNGINPIIPASEMACEMCKLQNDEFKDSVLSVCTLEANGGTNIIPDKAVLLGSFRSFDNSTREKACDTLKNTAREIAKNHNATCSFNYNFLYPPLINNADVTKDIFEAASRAIGEENISYFDKPLMTGEDFAYICERVPSCFFWYGGGKDKKFPLHSSQFEVDEKAIEICAKIFYEFSMKYLGE